ncbi:hypothetical protein KXR87_06125 [Yokenella regensburgei]
MGELKAWQIADHAPLNFEHDLRGQEIRRASAAGFDQRQGRTQTGLETPDGDRWEYRYDPFGLRKTVDRRKRHYPE